MIKPEFIFTAFIVALIPGTGAIYTINTGLTMKWRASLAAAIGCTLGIIPHITACILGLSAILNMSAQVFSVIKIAGSAYLLYLAWKMWREAGTLAIGQKSAEFGFGQIVTKAIAINLLNPKLTMFFLAFLPLFISKNASSPTLQMVTLSVVFMAVTFVVFALYGILASSISSYLMKSAGAAKRFQQIFAVIFAAFAVKLAFTEK
jgi:threonine/homoserine/homoserine lactone efflux protein